MSGYDSDRLADYVDVPARLAEFRAKHPEGSLQPHNLAEPYRVETIADRTYIVVVAAAYRTPDDPRPGIGMAYEQFPGRTPYTRDSELQNAETSAWGRAIVAALAADTKRSVASAEEVRNRAADREWEQSPTWDPAEQDVLVTGWTAEIEDARDETALKEIGRKLLAAKRRKELSPASYDHLALAGAARKAEMNGASSPGSMITKTRGRMFSLFTALGLDGDDNAEGRRTLAGSILGRLVPSVGALSEADALLVVAGLERRKREMAGAK